MVIWAKDEEGILRGYIVERDFKGLTTPKLEGKFSLRASETGQIFLEDVFVPEENLLPNVQALEVHFHVLIWLDMELLGVL